ncbi:MAG TPA: fibronectin type III-like domain-contianing protein [Chitinophagaceae bacterium]|nr:fibronectin type III-like domain-contianing protein [Chitinophagaceae bacterium]
MHAYGKNKSFEIYFIVFIPCDLPFWRGAGSVVRPVKELKDFQKIKLQPGESKIIRFAVTKEKLSFCNDKLQWIAEPGEFDLMIGSSSEDIRTRDSFELVK